MHKPDEKLTSHIRNLMPFASFLDLSIVEMSSERVVGVADWTFEKTTAGGAMHGGYLMGCVDAIGAIAAFYNLPAGSAGTTTIESKTNFFRAVREGTIRMHAIPVHVGRTTIVVQTDVLDDHERLVCRTTQTQLVLGPKQAE
jgi:1,4-dihydroxy-2-naphthoyl-CoA hydrolase